jgi:uncharacterized membrane protein
MSKKYQDSTLWAFLGVFLLIIGFFLVLVARKDDKYAMYYAKMGLILFIAWVVVGAFALIPIVGWIINSVGGIFLLIVWILVCIASFSGEKKKIPVLTELAAKIKV